MLGLDEEQRHEREAFLAAVKELARELAPHGLCDGIAPGVRGANFCEEVERIWNALVCWVCHAAVVGRRRTRLCAVLKKDDAAAVPSLTPGTSRATDARGRTGRRARSV